MRAGGAHKQSKILKDCQFFPRWMTPSSSARGCVNAGIMFGKFFFVASIGVLNIFC
jgi:hypothetical protein